MKTNRIRLKRIEGAGTVATVSITLQLDLADASAQERLACLLRVLIPADELPAFVKELGESLTELTAEGPAAD